MEPPSIEHYLELTAMKPEYEKWESGINYNTGRSIKIGGKLHKELGAKFTSYIKYKEYIDNPVIYFSKSEKIATKPNNYSGSDWGNKHICGGTIKNISNICKCGSCKGLENYKECLACGCRSDSN